MIASLTLRSTVFSKPMGNRLRASCCVIVLAPARSPVSTSLTSVTRMRETLRPKCCSKSASSVAMIACRSAGAMSS